MHQTNGVLNTFLALKFFCVEFFFAPKIFLHAVKFCAFFFLSDKFIALTFLELKFSFHLFFSLKKYGSKYVYNAKICPIANPDLFIPLLPLLLPAAAPGPGPRVSSLLSLLFGNLIHAIWTPFFTHWTFNLGFHTIA